MHIGKSIRSSIKQTLVVGKQVASLYFEQRVSSVEMTPLSTPMEGFMPDQPKTDSQPKQKEFCEQVKDYVVETVQAATKPENIARAFLGEAVDRACDAAKNLPGS